MAKTPAGDVCSEPTLQEQPPPVAPAMVASAMQLATAAQYASPAGVSSQLQHPLVGHETDAQAAGRHSPVSREHIGSHVRVAHRSCLQRPVAGSQK